MMKRKERREKERHENMKALCFLLGFSLCFEMFMVIMTSWYVHEYHGEHYFVTGVVENITSRIEGGKIPVIKLQVNGDEYEIMRPSHTSKVLPYDYGVQGDNALEAMDALEMRLWGETGKIATIEYIQFDNRVLGLTIGDTQYLNADEVQEEHIAYQTLGAISLRLPL